MSKETYVPHTPGPWHIGQYGLSNWITSDAADICELADWDNEFAGAEKHANGLLIVAAPDLLEACKKALALLDGFNGAVPECKDVAQDLDHAISKATGGSR